MSASNPPSVFGRTTMMVDALFGTAASVMGWTAVQSVPMVGKFFRLSAGGCDCRSRSGFAALRLRAGGRNRSQGGVANGNMSAGCRTRHGSAESDKWYARLPEVSQQRTALSALGMDRYVHCIPVVESQAVMCRCLTERAHRQRMPEIILEEFFDSS